jgi:hypothetical protein
MGSTKFEGGLLQKCLQLKVQKTTPNQRLELLTKELQVLQCLHNSQIDTKIHKDTTRCK